MKLLVGYLNNASGQDALKLGIMLAQLLQGELVVCQILPKPTTGKKATKVDEDYHEFLYQQAKHAFEKAKLAVPNDIATQYVIRTAESAASGLYQTAADVSADCIVMGSEKMAITGEFLPGSVAKNLLDHINLPLALAPKGFSQRDLMPSLSRLSCAVSGSKKSYEIVAQAAEWARLFGVPLRLVVLGVRDTDITPTAAGFDAENIVINEWREQLESVYQQFVQSWDHDVAISLDIGDGDNWQAAIRSVEWLPDEMLMVGFNKGEILKHFLSSHHVEKILRYAFVPRLVIPRVSH